MHVTAHTFKTLPIFPYLFVLVLSCFHSDDDSHLPTVSPADTIAANHAARSPQKAVHRKVALDNVRIFDGNRILAPSTVIIDGAFIGTDEKGAEHINGKGQVLLPGLIDTHCHPQTVEDLRQLSSYGVTTAFLQSGSTPAMRASLQNHNGLTDLRYASKPATVANASSAVPPAIAARGVLSDPAQVPTFIANASVSTSDWVKILAFSSVKPVLNALVSAAHSYGKFTVVHATEYQTVRQALLAGADQIHHSPVDKPLDEAIIQLYLAGKQPNCPTLTAMQAIADAVPEAHYDYSAAEESVRVLYKAGVPILAGTDANLQPGIPFKVPFGDSLHLELELLVKAGLSNLDALRGATLLPAKYYGLRDRGGIGPGMRADLLLVEGNPLKNISRTRDISRIWVAGVEHVVNVTTTLTVDGLETFNDPHQTGKQG